MFVDQKEYIFQLKAFLREMSEKIEMLESKNRVRYSTKDFPNNYLSPFIMWMEKKSLKDCFEHIDQHPLSISHDEFLKFLRSTIQLMDKTALVYHLEFDDLIARKVADFVREVSRPELQLRNFQ